MPEISLFGDALDPWRVQSVMLFPCDEVSRARLFAFQAANDIAHSLPRDTPVSLPAGTLQDLLKSPSYREWKPIIEAETKRAMVAGRVLCILYLMDKFGVREPSLNKAYWAAAEHAADIGVWGNKDAMNASETDVKKSWKSHKAAAALWAAQVLNKHYPFCGRRQVFKEGFPAFLGAAKEIEQWCLRFIPHRPKQKRTLLDAANMWCLPAHIQSAPPNFNTPPDALLEMLSRYRAPRVIY